MHLLCTRRRDPACCPSAAQKSILGLVQSAPCKLEVAFKDSEGKSYKKTAVVKSGKNGETEELPLFTNKDTILGEVGSHAPACGWNPLPY